MCESLIVDLLVSSLTFFSSLNLRFVIATKKRQFSAAKGTKRMLWARLVYRKKNLGFSRREPKRTNTTEHENAMVACVAVVKAFPHMAHAWPAVFPDPALIEYLFYFELTK
jgi:hypothetical protein